MLSLRGMVGLHKPSPEPANCLFYLISISFLAVLHIPVLAAPRHMFCCHASATFPLTLLNVMQIVDHLAMAPENQHLAEDTVASGLRQVLRNVDQVYTMQNQALVQARERTHPGKPATEAVVAKQRCQALGCKWLQVTPKLPKTASTRDERDAIREARGKIQRGPKLMGVRHLKPMTTTQERP